MMDQHQEGGAGTILAPSIALRQLLRLTMERLVRHSAGHTWQVYFELAKNKLTPDIGLSQHRFTFNETFTCKQDTRHMEPKPMLRGMANVSYWADDLKQARQWYTELFGMEPYFQRPDAENPAYIEYRVGDYQHEVGIIDKKYSPKLAKEEPGGAVLYWHVDDIQKAMERLLSMGAKEYEPITQRGEGFVTAAVTDPFGNVVGVMYNRHYLDMLTSIKAN